MKTLIIMGALLMTSSAQAQMCDFEKHCYAAPPPQVYHNLNGDVVPPPPPQYPPRTVTVHPIAPQVEPNVCKLAKIKDGPDIPARIVEICTMSDEEERAYREMARQREALIPRFNFPQY
jgi:hypothetical protein